MKIDQTGHSLTETVIVVAIIAILTAIAIPQLASAGARYRERAVVAEFASELRTARMLAMTRGRRVEVLPGRDGQSLNLISSGESGTLLRRYDFSGHGISIESWPEDRTVWFHPTGRSASPTTLTLCGAGQKKWDIIVSITGRISVS